MTARKRSRRRRRAGWWAGALVLGVLTASYVAAGDWWRFWCGCLVIGCWVGCYSTWVNGGLR